MRGETGLSFLFGLGTGGPSPIDNLFQSGIKPAFRPEGAISYDPHVMSFKALNQVSLLMAQGRVPGFLSQWRVSGGPPGGDKRTGRPALPQGGILPGSDSGGVHSRARGPLRRSCLETTGAL